jgi:hypothetical protein
MKRTLGALLLTLGLTLTVALPGTAAVAAAPDDEVRGPACGNIENGVANYSSANGPATVFAQFDTIKASCDRLTFTLTVYTTGPEPSVIGHASTPGTGSTNLQLQAVVSGAPAVACVELTSSGGTTVDQAPNSPDGTCSVGAEVLLNGGVGASGMR